jgi:hypothetical protein
MNVLRSLAVALALFAHLPLGGALNSVATPSTQEAPAGPTVSFQGSFPLTVEAGDYNFVYLVLCGKTLQKR